jgi:hypothetical protein
VEKTRTLGIPQMRAKPQTVMPCNDLAGVFLVAGQRTRLVLAAGTQNGRPD